MVLVGHTEDMELVFNETFNQLAHQGDDGCFFLCCACRQIAVRALTYLHAADIVQRDAHGLGVLGGQSSRIYFDMAVAEVANVEVFTHSGHRPLFGLNISQQCQQCHPKLIVGLPVLTFANRQLAHSRLTAPDCLGDLGLRHLAVTLDVGYYSFPVHERSITILRCLSTINRFLFYVRYDHGY